MVKKHSMLSLARVNAIVDSGIMVESSFAGYPNSKGFRRKTAIREVSALDSTTSLPIVV